MRRIGVIAVQGDFEKHIEAIRRLEMPNLKAVEVRTPQDLEGVERAVLPGGESTTVGLLMDRYGLGDAIKERVKKGMPLWGTCMGMILMAKEIEGRDQYKLGLLDIAVRRN